MGEAPFVANTFAVLRTISSGDHPRADAKEVDNIGSDRDLPAKLEAVEAPIAQQSRKAKLGLGRRAAA